MADTVTTVNMLMVLPVASLRAGPQYAVDNTTAFQTIDAHDHTTSKGVKVPAGGLSIQSDLDINAGGSSTGNNLTGARSARLVNQSADLAASTDVCCIYAKGSDLYWNPNSATHVKITSGGTLNSAALVNNAWSYILKNADYTILASDTEVFFAVDSSGGARAITLPAANAVTAGRLYSIVDITGSAGTNNITIARAGADTIDGAASYVLRTAYAEVLLRSDGTSKWKVLSSSQQLNGASVTAAGALTTGNVLQVTGASALGYAAVNLAGGANFVTGTLPGTSVTQAAAATFGVLQLDTDLGGTAAAPTIVQLTGSAGVVSALATALTFDATVSARSITHAAAAAGAGANFTVGAQNAGTASSAGGKLILKSGSDLTAGETAAGAVEVQVGALSKVQFISGSATNATIQKTPLGAAGSGGSLTITSAAAHTTGSGGTLALNGGAAAGANQNGGGVTILGGEKTGTGLKGRVSLTTGNSHQLVQVAEVVDGSRVVALCLPTAVGTAEIGVGSTADGVIFIATAATAPSVNPVGGFILYVDPGTGQLRARGASGTVTNIASP